MAKSGTPFEIEVRDYVQQGITSGHFGLDPKLTVVRHKQPYWSADRESNIITDVSVELTRAAAAEYWYLWVLECKDLGRSVDVSDIEEFSDKIRQIKGNKGTMASRSAFSKGCLTIAKNRGIGLIRIAAPGQVKNIMESEAVVDYVWGLTEPNDALLPDTVYAMTPDERFTTNPFEFLREEIAGR